MFAPRVRMCYPHDDGLSSISHLLMYEILKKSVWLVALVTCAGNLLVFVWRSLSTKEDQILSLFVLNLSGASRTCTLQQRDRGHSSIRSFAHCVTSNIVVASFEQSTII